MSLMVQLAVGDKAPLFALKDQDGKTVRLSQFKGKPVIVYFYPKADTPGCTQQSCNLRDVFPQLKKLKAAVVGISPDAPTKQKKFDDKYQLGFPLLADEDHAVADAWGVWGEKSLYGKKFMGIVRSAFVVDEKGKLAGVFYKVSPKDTVDTSCPAAVMLRTVDSRSTQWTAARRSCISVASRLPTSRSRVTRSPKPVAPRCQADAVIADQRRVFGAGS